MDSRSVVAVTLPTSSLPLVVFTLDEHRYAVELDRVVRVLPRVELASVPGAPAVVGGVFALAGQAVPALQLRGRFGLPARPESLSDQFLVAQTTRRRVAFIVDRVEGITAVAPETITTPAVVAPGLEHLRGIVTLPEVGIVFVHDIEAFLSAEEDARLSAALALEAR